MGVTHNWLQSLNDGKEVCAVFFDLCKAFDSVPHRPLLYKLRDSGISRFFPYLHNRKQFVVLSGQRSSICSGVPQGSVLGPLLFLIYINDLPSVQLTPGTRVVLYADDILLCREITNHSDYDSLQSDIDSISQWVVSNHFNMNENKCKCCVQLCCLCLCMYLDEGWGVEGDLWFSFFSIG